MNTESFPLITSMPGTTVRRALWSLAAAVLCGVVLATVPSLRLTEERSRDALTALALSTQPVPGVAVIDISEESLRSVGTWPWPRARLADLVEELIGPLGARAVALDMVLPERGDAAGDARLASIARHGPLTLALVLDFAARNSAITVGTLAGGRKDSGPVAATASGHVANHAGLGDAHCVGHIGVQPDADGVLRRVDLEARSGDRRYATLSLAMMECADPGTATQALDRLAASRDAAWRIPFRKAASAFVTVPAEAVLNGQVPSGLLRGRYVLIGSSAVGLSDYVATPLQPVTAGVLVHAQVLSELLEASQRPAGRAAAGGGWLTLAATAAGLFVLAAGLTARVRLGVTALVTLVLLWMAACVGSFEAGLRPLVLAPIAAWAGYGLTWLALDLAQARTLTRRAMRTLSQYVAAPVLKLLVRQGLQNTLAPSRRHITVMVADMAGYTRLTAQSTLEQSARLTTEFLEAITRPVLDSGGTLDRYTGDGLIAFWGAPLVRDDHAQGAAEAALKMFAALADLNEGRVARGEVAVTMRIGIESGEALVGDLGSSARSVYTAVGTCINLASRLQELARDRGERTMVGPRAAAAIDLPMRRLEPAAVRGLAEPIDVFSLEIHAHRI